LLDSKSESLKGKILVTAQPNPDIDRVACIIGYSELLQKQGIDAHPGIVGNIHREALFILENFNVNYSKVSEKSISGFDEFILVDSSSRTGLSENIDINKVVEIIDHRKSNEAHVFKNAKIQIEFVGAAATLIVEKFMESGTELSEGSRILLYGAIVSNTLNFKSNTTTGRDKKAAEWLKKRLNLPYGRVVLTFDDIGNQLAKSGLQKTHDDFWENIYPVLNKYGFKGVLGVVTGGISNEGWTWDEIRRLADEGHEIASHSATHNLGMNQAYLNRPGGFSREQFIDEFRRSRYDIQNNTGRAPITYIWPFGAVKYGSDAAEIYPVRVTVWETGPVSGLSQLGSVPRYHPDGHVNDFGITIARALGFGGPTATQLEKATGDTDTYTEKNRNYGVGFNSEALRARHAEKFRDVET